MCMHEEREVPSAAAFKCAMMAADMSSGGMQRRSLRNVTSTAAISFLGTTC